MTVKASSYEQNLYEKLQKYDFGSKTLKLVVLLLTANTYIYEQNLHEKLQKCDWHRGKGISKRL